MTRFTTLAGLLMLAACNHVASPTPTAEMFMSAAADIPAPAAASPEPEPPRAGLDGCKDTIAARAKRHGAIHVEAVEAGAPLRLGSGMTEVTLDASIVYQQGNLVQLREARVSCQWDAQGRVMALL